MLKIFNQYLAPAMPFISQNSSEAKAGLPLTVAAYMKETRNLGLLCVKGDLRSNILEKTAVKVDQI